MKQMSLFSAEAEEKRTLQEAYNLLCHDYRSVEARLEKAKVEYRKVQEERAALRAKVDQLRRERDSAQLETRHWKAMYDIALMLRPPASAPAALALEPTLKRLLTIAHPDRWQRGQSAAELAHELTVTINRLRAEGRP